MGWAGLRTFFRVRKAARSAARMPVASNTIVNGRPACDRGGQALRGVPRRPPARDPSPEGGAVRVQGPGAQGCSPPPRGVLAS